MVFVDVRRESHDLHVMPLLSCGFVTQPWIQGLILESTSSAKREFQRFGTFLLQGITSCEPLVSDCLYTISIVQCHVCPPVHCGIVVHFFFCQLLPKYEFRDKDLVHPPPPPPPPSISGLLHTTSSPTEKTRKYHSAIGSRQ